MTRTLKLMAVALALVALLMGATPVAAARDGAAYGACVAHHATTETGLSAEHNPGIHQGYAGWPGCPD